MNENKTVVSGEKEKNSSSSKICISCKKVIKDQFVRALGEIYHLDCFRCIDCNEICVSKFFPFEEDGVTRPLCETDYFRRLDLICAKCGGALRGPHINALNKKYHLEHFTCTVCNVVFQPNASYYEYNGNIYCQNHYSALFAQKCGGCRTPVLRQLIEVNKNNETQEQWHPECYMIYKSWNVKLVLDNEDDIDKPIEPKDFSAEIEKQKIVEEKIAKIWSILSSFEESSAKCMLEILSYASNNLYINGIEQAGNFVCHVDVLFSGIDEIEDQLRKFNDKTGLQHTKEPKLLAKRIVNFFALLTHKNSNTRQDTTKEFLNLVTTLARTLKILIRAALCGALKLENQYHVETALDSFLGKFLTLGNMKTELRQQQLIASREYSIESEYCLVCKRSVEEECVKLNYSRWHQNCFYCENCKKNLYNSLEEARMEPTSKIVLCRDCSPSNVIAGFIRVTQLEQYTFLLKFALKRLYIINMKNENAENNAVPTDSNDEIVSPSLRQQSNNLKGKLKQTSNNSSEPRQAKLEDASSYYALEEEKTEKDNIKERENNNEQARPHKVQYHRLNSNSEQYAQKPNDKHYPNPIRKSYSHDQSMDQMNNHSSPQQQQAQPVLQQRNRNNNEMLSRSPDTLLSHSPKQMVIPQKPQQSLSPKVNYNLHRSYSHGTKYAVNPSTSPPPLYNNNVIINANKSPNSPNLKINHSRSQSPNNLVPNSQLNHASINFNEMNSNGIRRSISSPNQMNDNIYIDKNYINDSGVQYYNELSAYDMITLKHMAVNTLNEILGNSGVSLDLSNLIEERKLRLWEKVVTSFRNNQKKTKIKEGTFGVPLEILVERYGVNSDLSMGQGTVKIPLFIEKVIRALKTKDLTIEGIFRKNGNIRRLKELTESLDQNPENVNFIEDNAIQLAALLKKFLRELPEPLLTFKLHKVFILSQKQDDEKQRLKIIQCACSLLPRCNRDLLEVLLLFLAEVSTYSSKNKMDIDNLSTIIAPTICYSKSKDPIKDDSFLAIEVLRMMMSNQEKLWIVQTDVNNMLEMEMQQATTQVKDVKKKNEGMVKAHSSNDFRVENLDDYHLVNSDIEIVHPGSEEKIDMYQ